MKRSWLTNDIFEHIVDYFSKQKPNKIKNLNNRDNNN